MMPEVYGPGMGKNIILCSKDDRNLARLEAIASNGLLLYEILYWSKCAMDLFNRYSEIC